MELEVLKITGESTGRKVQLNENIFGITPNDHCMYLDTKLYMANKRQGTHKAKTRSEISGSTRKLIRQKGTGGARRGDINSPLLRGGGRVFGPVPRDYSFKLNKKVRRLARRSALTYKMNDSEIVIIEDFTFETIKTKNMVSVLNNFKVNGSKNLFVFPETNDNVILSARNIQRTKIELARNLTTYDILNAKKLFITESSLAVIDEILG
ncbi:MAG: 50S ribosomal protein L4 [Candidatus Limimorpha sp.]|nr:50S ribosomal protein L4 [Bacteroidales bacterium]MCI7377517.1 50S ribosomal protein L4 [Bacteroidales bacterium]MDD5978454.1 50S ribosomal protein L4 [Bacteroidales bacterium]MDD7277474.1 50S ribosomal protein L4 [Bacteroidales bacterium]MDY6075748.1 50S ribosomal protein L4 [Bacteroidales bacterium]